MVAKWIELVTGSLNSRERAMFPLIAALGGMLAPALIFTASPSTLRATAPAATRQAVSRAEDRPQRPGQNGLHLPQLPDEQEAHPARREHADMAVPPPEQLQPHVSPAADAEEQTFLEKSHVFSPRRKYCQKFQQKNEKMS